MEENPEWHARMDMTQEELDRFLKELGAEERR